MPIWRGAHADVAVAEAERVVAVDVVDGDVGGALQQSDSRCRRVADIVSVPRRVRRIGPSKEERHAIVDGIHPFRERRHEGRGLVTIDLKARRTRAEHECGNAGDRAEVTLRFERDSRVIRR